VKQGVQDAHSIFAVPANISRIAFQIVGIGISLNHDMYRNQSTYTRNEMVPCHHHIKRPSYVDLN
jgi:hypothetical protein